MLLLFENYDFRARITNWEICTRHLMGHFRKYYDQNPNDSICQNIVSRLYQQDFQFKEWWLLHEVQEKTAIPLIIDHPTVGRLNFELRCFTS
jgi:hypothetical protein